jgi:hypothetical protein
VGTCILADGWLFLTTKPAELLPFYPSHWDVPDWVAGELVHISSLHPRVGIASSDESASARGNPPRFISLPVMRCFTILPRHLGKSSGAGEVPSSRVL